MIQTAQISAEARAQFMPHGILRVALNHGNGVLVGRHPDGRPKGISVEIAQALAAHLGAEMRFVEFQRAFDVSSSAGDDVWDVGFLAVDPERARTIDFTAPYVGIEGCYMAGAHSAATDAPDLVASGSAVGSVTGSAYTLTLQRQPGAQHLRLYETMQDMLAALDRAEVDAVAGIRGPMQDQADMRPGARVLLPAFMEIRQAMAMPIGRPAAAAALATFLADAARSGLIGDILERNGVSRACAIVPAAP